MQPCYLRDLLRKHLRTAGAREVSDSITGRRFCRIPLDAMVPHPTTLMKLTTKCGTAAVPQTPDRPLGDEISPRTQPALSKVLTPEQLREAEALAMGTLVEATAAHRNAQVALDHATRDLGAHEALVRLFATDALLRGARATIDQTIGTFVAETIGPIAAELGPRWSTLFPGRGRPYVDGDGGVTRPVNGEGLPFESFSGGERVGALLLLRLLVAQMTTTLTFCWFDEPLEHLDPDTRRQVAGLLSGASRSHPLRQIVLTTYEESLAARLAADSPDEVDLLAVRSAR